MNKDTILPKKKRKVPENAGLDKFAPKKAAANVKSDDPVKKTYGNLPGPGPGRPKGMPNKTTTEVKQMILDALAGAGGVEYLIRQADEKPAAFMALLGKVMPMQVVGDPDAPISIQVIQRVVVDPAAK